MLIAVKFIHLFALVLWVGTLLFFSFIAAPAVFKTLSRESAGEVVGVIFPKYWILGYTSSILILVTLLILSSVEGVFPLTRVVIIAIMTVTTFYSGLVVGKKARAIKASIKATEDAGEIQALRKEFGRTHGVSAVLNLIVVVLGVVFVFLTAMNLHIG